MSIIRRSVAAWIGPFHSSILLLFECQITFELAAPRRDGHNNS